MTQNFATKPYKKVIIFGATTNTMSFNGPAGSPANGNSRVPVMPVVLHRRRSVIHRMRMAVRLMLARVALWRQKRREMTILSHVDDRLLADMGVTRDPSGRRDVAGHVDRFLRDLDAIAMPSAEDGTECSDVPRRPITQPE
jgi:uncharacterized protein YjiS (DUF1127 family)